MKSMQNQCIGNCITKGSKRQMIDSEALSSLESLKKEVSVMIHEGIIKLSPHYNLTIGNVKSRIMQVHLPIYSPEHHVASQFIKKQHSIKVCHRVWQPHSYLRDYTIHVYMV